MADKYIIRVTVGPGYDMDDHVVVPVNSPEPVRVSGGLMEAEVNVRLEGYQGLPRGSPTSSPYFSAEPHASNRDRCSLAIRFTPKKPSPLSSSGQSKSASAAGTTTATAVAVAGTEKTGNQDVDDQQERNDPEQDETDDDDDDDDDDDSENRRRGISGLDLQFGNDFDHPIRDRLPPGFGYAMNIVKWWIDPGLEGDAYADMPYLYGPALSSFNTVHVGPGDVDPGRGGLWFEEGGDERGLGARAAAGAPPTAKERMRWALKRESKEGWVFEYGRTYCVDFFNPYLDFGDFSLRLPGFTLPIMKYWDGQPLRSDNDSDDPQVERKRSHTLRYVLRNRATDATYLVIMFTLYLREDVNEDGSLKPAALESARHGRSGADGGKTAPPAGEDGDGGCGDDDKQDYEEAKNHFQKSNLGKGGAEKENSKDDDVD